MFHFKSLSCISLKLMREDHTKPLGWHSYSFVNLSIKLCTVIIQKSTHNILYFFTIKAARGFDTDAKGVSNL